jgi:hypothetical protein
LIVFDNALPDIFADRRAGWLELHHPLGALLKICL